MTLNFNLKNVHTKSITFGALAVALVIVSFTLFKGVTNILNALLVPLALSLVSLKLRKMEIITILICVILICFFFFYLQLFFIFFYCAISILLVFLSNKKVKSVLSVLILTVATSLSFWIAIILTDAVFATKMNTIMLNVFKGNYSLYSTMLLVEGLIVSVAMFLLFRAVSKRMHHFSSI